MAFFAGGPPINVTYFRAAPNAKVFPFPNAFCSRNWDTEEEWGDVGEIRPGLRPWARGIRPAGATGLGDPCEPAKWWAEGMPGPITPARSVDVAGTPQCCAVRPGGGVGNGQCNVVKLKAAILIGGGVGSGKAGVVPIMAVGMQQRSTADQPVVPAGLVSLSLVTSDWNYGGFFTLNNIDFTVPLHGLYSISIGATWSIVGGPVQFSTVELRVRKNNVDLPGFSQAVQVLTPPRALAVGFTQSVELQAGDVIKVIAINNEPGGASTWKVNPCFLDINLLAQLP